MVRNQYSKHKVLMGWMVVLAGCGNGGGEGQEVGQAELPLMIQAASEATLSETQVASWEFWRGEQHMRIVARDSADRLRGEVRIENDASVTVSYPSEARFVMSSDGLHGEASDEVVHLVNAMFSDFTANGEELARAGQVIGDFVPGTGGQSLAQPNDGVSPYRIVCPASLVPICIGLAYGAGLPCWGMEWCMLGAAIIHFPPCAACSII